MRKYIYITALVAGSAGFVAGNAFWYLASPLWIDRVVSETLVQTAQTATLASGAFRDANASHRGKGNVAVLRSGGRTLVRFTDFEVTNGPDLYVWLVRAPGVAASADVKASESLELGRLKGNIGDQNYALPAGTDVSRYHSVVIWCRQFGVLFAVAELE